MPQLEDQRASRRRVVALISLDQPRKPQHCGNIREIRVVPNYNDNAIAGFAERSRDRPARDSLLHSLEDVTQQVRSLYACDVCRSAQQIGVCRMEAHHLPQVGFVDSAPTDFLLGHSVGVFEKKSLRKRRSCAQRSTQLSEMITFPRT